MSNPEFQHRNGLPVILASTVVDEIIGEARGYARGPERSLLGALLFDGIQGYIDYALAQTTQQKAHYVEAFNWVMDLIAEEPFSFNGVCEALGVCPEYLRLGLSNASTSLLHEVGRSRRNF